MNKNFLFVLTVLSLSLNAQESYSIKYNHLYGIESFKEKPIIGGSNKNEVLFIDSFGVSFYSFNPLTHRKNKEKVGGKLDNHAVFSFPLQKRYLLEYTYLSPPHLQEDTFKQRNWVITNDSMIIAGFVCKQAVAEEVIAWYSSDIPINVGPAYYNGLPGLILRVEDHSRRWLIEAYSIDKNCPSIILPKLKLKSCRTCDSKLEEIKNRFSH